MPTFLENIDLLTVDQKTFVDTDNGKKLVDRVALLKQLRSEVFLGMEGVGGSASFGSRPPIDGGAYDVLNEIDRQAAEALRSVDSRPAPLGFTETYVRLWAAATDENKVTTVTVSGQHSDAEMDQGKHWKAVYYTPLQLPAWMLAQHWVDRIEGLFNPPSTSEVKGKCPACEEEFSHRMKDGQLTRSKALAFIRNDKGESVEARCLACRASWGPDQFEWLLSTLAAQDAAENEKPIPTIKYRPSYCVNCYHDGHADYINLAGRCACDCHTEEAA